MADLVLLSLGGVQRFLRESRTTGDVAGASRIVQDLAWLAARAVHDGLVGEPEPYGLIVPSLLSAGATSGGATNKIAFLAPRGRGEQLAGDVAGLVRDTWQSWVDQVFPGTGAATPGMPDVSWVRVTGPAAGGEYAQLWKRARESLVARRRARVFVPVLVKRASLCSQAPHLPASPVPVRAYRHERQSRERLSVAGWVKRLAARDGDMSFPSTVAIASASFRARLIGPAASPREDLAAAVAGLASCVDELDPPRERPLRLADVPPGLEPLATRLGTWVFVERWEADGLRRAGVIASPRLVERGRRAARSLLAAARGLAVRPPSPYFAVVVQDLDRLGQALDGLSLDQHRAVSRALSELAGAQWQLASSGLPLPAEPIYAGGDDFLAFCPAAGALALARRVRQLVTEHLSGTPLVAADGGPVTATTAVVFAHMGSPLQEVLGIAHEALKTAKDAGVGENRNALTVVVRRRGGERARTIQPWGNGMNAADLLETVQPVGLSPSLASRLELDRRSLSDLARDELWTTLSAELARLVARQGGTPRAAGALVELGRTERYRPPARDPFDRPANLAFDPVPAALTARFLVQECQ